jgi:hypothetical protein
VDLPRLHPVDDAQSGVVAEGVTVNAKSAAMHGMMRGMMVGNHLRKRLEICGSQYRLARERGHAMAHARH